MKSCHFCGKTSQVTITRKKLRGKYNPTNKKRKYPNLQPRRIDGKKILVCAKCLKAGKLLKAQQKS